jgi:transposase
MLIVGLDWARAKHDLVMMDHEGRVQARRTIEHTGDSLQATAHWLHDFEPDPGQIQVAVEMHDGALLAFLLAQGYTVFGINPKSAERARDRYRPGGGKDDTSDAFVLADMLRTDRGTLRPISRESEATQALRSLVEVRDKRIHDRTALFHRLRQSVDEWAPEISKLCDDFDRNWQRDLLSRWPLIQDLNAVHGKTINAFIRQHRLGKTTAERIRQTRQAEPIALPAGREQAVRLDIQQLLSQIEQLNEAIADLDQRISEQVAEHPDAQLFQSLPINADNTVAHLLAGFGEDREQPRSAQTLAAAWGVAPVTIASGKHKTVRRRQAADHTMNQALMHFAFNTAMTAECWASDFYRRKRAEGTAHYTALRCLAQRWVKILYAMWKHQTPYDEQHHRQRLATAG